MCENENGSNFIPCVSLIDGQPTTTSRAIAEHFEKRHDHVLRDIQNLLADCPGEFGVPNFGESSYVNEQGKDQPMYNIRFDGFILLVMGYTGKKALAMKLAYIEAFNKMRSMPEGKAVEAAHGDCAITPDQQRTLQDIVRARVEKANQPVNWRKGYQQVWSRFNNHFRLGSYKQLPQSRMSEAVAYLVALEHRPLEKPEQPRLKEPCPLPEFNEPGMEPFREFLEKVDAARARAYHDWNELLLEGSSLQDARKGTIKAPHPFTHMFRYWLKEQLLSPAGVFDSASGSGQAPAMLARALNSR